MKKSLLALAVLGAFASAAQAQSSVTLYGLVDTSAAYLSNTSAAGASWLAAASEATNRLGFKGTEDLGGGLKATFQLENGFNLQTGTLKGGVGATGANVGGIPQYNGKLFDRGATIGMSGSFGSFTAGRNWTPFALSQIAVDSNYFRNTGSINTQAAATASTGAVGSNYIMTYWTDSSLVYNTPNMGGFSGSVLLGLGGVSGDNSGGTTWSLSGTYANGPLTVSGAYLSSKNTAAYYNGAAPAGVVANDTVVIRDWHLGGKYNFGPVIASLEYANYQNPAQQALANDSFYTLGLAAPFNASMIGYFNWTHRSDKNFSVNNANAYTFALDYNMSKTFTVYGNLGFATNNGGSATPMGVSVANINVGAGTLALAAGQNQTYVAVGVRKSF